MPKPPSFLSMIPAGSVPHSGRAFARKCPEEHIRHEISADLHVVRVDRVRPSLPQGVVVQLPCDPRHIVKMRPVALTLRLRPGGAVAHFYFRLAGVAARGVRHGSSFKRDTQADRGHDLDLAKCCNPSRSK
jgi:hypothetical protein